jgi:RimJ/RimL family protein N-acetyltransferase
MHEPKGMPGSRQDAAVVTAERGGEAVLHATLRDGSPVVIRRLGPDDREPLRELFRRLSPASRYRRFLSLGSEPAESQLSYLATVEPDSHPAWIALDGAAPVPRAIGVAEYVRFETDPGTAEVSVTVADAYQGRGLGTLLLGALSRTAVAEGIDRFVAYVLSDNTPMLRIFRDMGATRAESIEAGVQRLEMPVPRDPRDLPNTALGRVFRAVAREMGAKG